MHTRYSFLFSTLLLLGPRGVSAALPWQLANPAPGAGVTLQDFVYLLLNILQLVAVPALVIGIIYGGFLLVTAGGNETNVTKAKQWILWSLVGGIIILGATVIADIVYGTAAAF